MTATLTPSKRQEWIDWMKALGIYLVVLGHFYSVGEKQIYIFHVPLFFVISGFLCKKESDQVIFWKKLWYNLMVPMLIMAVVNFVYACILQLLDGTFGLKTIYWFVRNALFGMVSGYGVLWFILTLVMLKIIFQYCLSKVLFFSLTVVMLALAYVYYHSDLSGYPFFLNAPNTVIDVFIAYPFFALGVLAREFKGQLNEWGNKVMLALVFVCGILLVWVSDLSNSYVAMYKCDYGGNMLWFLVGGVAGSMMIFAASKLLGHALKSITIISRGTIIILGFHKLFIDLIRTFFSASIFDILLAAVIVMLFIPLIIMSEQYFPLMGGKYRVSK
jgi:fucose 4-O-acetylase-like acetyltransferase